MKPIVFRSESDTHWCVLIENHLLRVPSWRAAIELALQLAA
ncbi:hypothetical protein [Microbacterium sp. gxy059]